MYLYVVLQGKACDCDVSAVDFSIGNNVESDKAILWILVLRKSF